MYKKNILAIFFIGCFISSRGQCPGDDTLSTRMNFLRDSSGLTSARQIEILSGYEKRIGGCRQKHDSVHARLLARIGELYYSLPDYSEAIRYYKRNIDVIIQNASKPSVNLKQLIPSYYWLSVFYDSLHRVTDKMEALDSCAAVSIRLKSIDTYCLWALYTRTEYFFDIGDYHRCINYANLCESLATDYAQNGPGKAFIEGTQYAMSSLLWNVNALMVLRKYDDAMKLLQIKASECKRKELQHNLGVIYGLLAEVLILKGDFENVLLYHNKAFAIEKREGEPINCKAMLNALGYEVYFKHYKDIDKALSYYTMALDYKVDEGEYRTLNALESLSILNRIANVYALKGRYNDALKYMQLAFDQIKPGISEKDLLHSSLDDFIRQRRIGYIANLIADKALVFHQKYKASGDANDIKEAVRIYKVADMFLEKIKNEQSDVRSKLFWRRDRRRLYEHAIEACYDYNNMTDAFYFFERSRAILLFDELNKLRWMNNEDIARQSQLSKIVAQLGKELMSADKSSTRSRQLQEEIMKNSQELDKLNDQIRARDPQFYQNFLRTDQISLGDVQRSLLQGNDKLVEFFDGDSAVYSLLISRNEIFFQKIGKDSFDRIVNEFVSYVSNYARLNKNFDHFIDVSHRLHELIFGNNSVSTGRIILSPDSHYFPAEALVDKKGSRVSYLIQNHPVSYVPSARFLMIDFDTGRVAGVKNFLGMAPVNFRSKPNMTTLAGSDVSLAILKSNFHNSDCMTFEMASKNNFTREFPEYRIVQLYAHASDNKDGGEPEIYFADSILHLSDLINERRPSTELIVLSACETGTGDWYSGEGVFSFNRGFSALGIPSSVTNLWSIDNKSTYRLTELFYGYLAKGMDKDIAMQKAKLQFMGTGSREDKMPYFWAAAILVGKTDAVEFYATVDWGRILPLLGIVVIALVSVASRKIYKRRKLRTET